MIRAIHFGAAAFLVSFGLCCAAFGQSLPSLRRDISDDGGAVNLGVNGRLAPADTPNGDETFDFGDAHVHDTDATGATGGNLSDNAVGYVNASVIAAGNVSTATGASDFAPEVEASAGTNSNCHTVDEELHNRTAELYTNIWAIGSGSFQIAANSDYPDAGIDENSATITEYLSFEVTGSVKSGAVGNRTNPLYA